MRPHALMLAVVLLGNLMLPLASAQNGKDTDATPQFQGQGGNGSNMALFLAEGK